MQTQLKEMQGKEFVSKLLAGERDFSGIELERGFNFPEYERFGQLQTYLRGQELHRNPVNIGRSNFSYVDAQGIYLPHLQAQEANLERAYLMGANLDGADLKEAKLERANLKGVKNLGQALSLGYAVFDKTRVTTEERKIIEAARAEVERTLFIVED